MWLSTGAVNYYCLFGGGIYHGHVDIKELLLCRLQRRRSQIASQLYDISAMFSTLLCDPFSRCQVLMSFVLWGCMILPFYTMGNL